MMDMGIRRDANVLWRLTVAELFVLRKRRVTRVVLAIGVGSVVAFVLIRTALGWAVINEPLSDFTPPFCPAAYAVPGCVTHIPTGADLAAYKQLRIRQTVAHLSLPLSLNNISGSLIGSFLYIGMIIVAGVMVGGEYSERTIRLMYTRGPTRLQFLRAKMLAASICIIPVYLFLNALGLALAQAGYVILGFSPQWDFFTPEWFGHALLYLSTGLMIWFVNTQMAFFFGAWGRSKATAIVATLLWWAFEFALYQIISAFTDPNSTFPSHTIRAFSDYLVWSNLYALHDNLAHMVYGGDAGSVSSLHAIAVLAAYVTLFVGLTCWITVRHDVTD